MKYLEVAVAAPLGYTLTYAAPESCQTKLTPGLRLLVPLGNRLVTGYLFGPAAPPPAKQRTKPVADILDPWPFFDAEMVPFFRWIADYYLHPIGEVVKEALPAGITTKSGRRFRLTSQGEKHLVDWQWKKPPPPWFAGLIKNQELSPAANRRIRTSRDRTLLSKWTELDYLKITDELTGETTKPKTEICVLPQPDILRNQDIPGLLVSEIKTLDLIVELIRETGQNAVPRRDLTRKYNGAGKALKSLAVKGLISFIEKRVFRDPFGEPPAHYPKPPHLSDEQEKTLAELTPAIRKQQYAPFLLHGITGSGKTEVYLRAAEEVLKLNRTVLVLVPEIALATQLEGHFYSRFGDQIALLHSGLSKGERLDQWHRLATGEATIVIGARSAIFAPIQNPGLIIVDEEHDPAFKQEDGLRYQARDLAVLRASLANCVVILGSATPSITSSYHARQGKYKLLSMTRRIADRALPEVEVVNLRETKTVSGRPPLFSPQLIAAIRQTHDQGNQSLIFLNRRGYASTILCRQCGKTVQCRHCHVTMTQHQTKNQLLCHYCGFTLHKDILCPSCNSPGLIGVGFGTERVEKELEQILPNARIARLDRDTSDNRKKFLAILQAMRNREIDILVGTQMITKGHHFPDVTLVGVVWADAGMGLPDFRAGERTFQLLTQVTGRAGRGESPGKVIIQTNQPNHYSVITAKAHAYDDLYNQELALRQGLGYPPLSRLVNLVLEGEDEELVQKTADILAGLLRQFLPPKGIITILGPAPSPLSRLRDKFRWQILLKGSSISALHTICRRLKKAVPSQIRSGRVKLAVDVDPENML